MIIMSQAVLQLCSCSGVAHLYCKALLNAFQKSVYLFLQVSFCKQIIEHPARQCGEVKAPFRFLCIQLSHTGSELLAYRNVFLRGS